MSWPNISELVAKFNNGEISAEENVLKALELIEKNNKYNAIISINTDAAIAKAREIDQRRKSGENIGSA